MRKAKLSEPVFGQSAFRRVGVKEPAELSDLDVRPDILARLSTTRLRGGFLSRSRDAMVPST